MASFAGAARVAHNRMLAYVKADLELGRWERQLLGGRLEPAQGWSLAALRRTWNANKDVWAPWWREVSKEAFNTGLAQLADALKNWSDSKKGKRRGRPAGFPRFKSRARTSPSVAFTTGAIRVNADRRSVTLPRLGRIHTHESTRKLSRRLETGSARILRATCTRDAAGRWHVAFIAAVQRQIGPPAHVKRHQQAVGVDLNCGDLVAATADGTEVLRVAAPRGLREAQKKLGRLQRKAARQTKGSNRRRTTMTAIGSTHARAADVRRDALHKATTRLAQHYATIVVEDLNVAGMSRRKRGSGARGRGFNRAILDAGMGTTRRMLAYKTGWYGSELVVADRWYPSSKTCSSCSSRKPRLGLGERTYTCETCGVSLDRDRNAAINLARLASGPSTRSGREDANSGQREVDETDPRLSGSPHVGAAPLDDLSTPHQPSLGQTGTATRQQVAA
ncbi:IS607 family element RNA-guided endonuclease TnpB [soil metagenome]